MNKKWNVGWGTVSSCNMRCAFCYSRKCRRPTNDLTIREWINFVDANWQNINSINYGTGENSLSDDWFIFLDYVREKYPHIRQAVTTNGYISEAVKYDHKKYDIVLRAIDEMDISLDYADKRKHNEFRGQPQAFDWALDALDFCKKHEKRPTIVCLASAVNTNFENLNGIFSIAKDYAALVRMNLYRPTEGIDKFSSKFILSPERLIDMLYWISEKHTVLSISDALLSNLLTDKNEYDPSGVDSIRILPNGDITPSTYLINKEFIVGNIKDGEILRSVNMSKAMKSIVKEVIPAECKGCFYENTCRGGVLDRRYLWNGTLKFKDPYCLYTPGKPAMKKIMVADVEFLSVHHGYLPTMFFAPKN